MAEEKKDDCTCGLCQLRRTLRNARAEGPVYDEATVLGIDDFKNRFMKLTEDLGAAQVLDDFAKVATLQVWATIALQNILAMSEGPEEFVKRLQVCLNNIGLGLSAPTSEKINQVFH